MPERMCVTTLANLGSAASRRPLLPETWVFQPALYHLDFGAELVAGLACVDWVVGFGSDTPLRLIERLRPDVLAKGGDWGPDEIVGAEEVRSWGGRVERLSVVAGERTTLELGRIRERSRAKPR